MRGWTLWASAPYWDTLGVFLLECEPLNPIFVLEFLRLLAERGLLEYDAGERRWT